MPPPLRISDPVLLTGLLWAWICVKTRQTSRWRARECTFSPLENRSLSPSEARKVCARIYQLADQLPGHWSCLTRALACRRVLALHEYPTTLHYGVKMKQDPFFEAHAWVSDACGILADVDKNHQYSELQP